MSAATDHEPGRQAMKTQRAATAGGGALSRYRELIVGSRSLWRLVYFEWCMLWADTPGALGLLLRTLFWPRLFGSCGRKVFFGRGVVIRHPGRIHLGHRVVVGEGCVLDARCAGRDRVLVIGDDVNLSNDVMLSCKEGTIELGPRTGINAKTIIHSAAGNPVKVGADVVIGPMCYLVGGGNYHTERTDIPIAAQGIQADGGVVLEDGVWLGARVTVLGGVRMGGGSVAAAGAMVTRDVEPLAVVKGMPARPGATRAAPAAGAAAD